MANPQPYPFVQFSKELFGAVLLSPMPATQRNVVLAIIRRTYGDRGKKQAEISVGLLSRMLGQNKGTVSRALSDLIDQGVVTVVRAEHHRTTRILALNKDYEAWGPAYSVAAETCLATVAEEQPSEENNGCSTATLNDGNGCPPATPDPGNGCPTATQPLPVGNPDGCSTATTEDKSDTGDKSKSLMARPAVMKAPSDAEWQDRADAALAACHFPSDLLQLAGLRAGENKTGEMRVSRLVRELYEPIVGLQDSLSDEALRYGLRAAITAGAPNWRYVRKAAEGYRPNGHAGAGIGGGLSVQDILSGSFEPASVPTPDYDLEAEAIDDDS